MSVPPRTTVGAVQAILGGTAPETNWDGITDLTPQIQTASAIVDQVVTLAANKPTVLAGVSLNATIQERIECFLAAHFYCVLDPLYNSKNTNGASGSFQRGQGGPDSPFEETSYGRQACAMDYSGILTGLSRGKYAGGFWAGMQICGKPATLGSSVPLATGNFGTLTP